MKKRYSLVLLPVLWRISCSLTPYKALRVRSAVQPDNRKAIR